MSNKTFWMENSASSLISSFSILPSASNDASENLNNISRLALVIAAIIGLFDPAAGAITLAVSLVVVITAYYACVGGKTKDVRESYEDVQINEGLTQSSSDQAPCDDAVQLARDIFVATHATPPISFSTCSTKRFDESTSGRFCNDFAALSDEDCKRSVNQMLLGYPNAKTYRPPIIPAPSHDLESWRTNELVVHSAINDVSNYDDYRSGYVEDYAVPVSSKDGINRSCRRRNDSFLEPLDKIDRYVTHTIQPGVYQKTLLNEPIQANIGISYVNQFDPMLVTNVDRDGGIMYAAADGNLSLDVKNVQFSNDRSRRRINLDPIASNNGVVDGDCTQRQLQQATAERKTGYLTNTSTTQQQQQCCGPLRLSNSNGGNIVGDSGTPGIGDNVSLGNTTLNDMLYNASKYAREGSMQTEYDVYDPRFTGYAGNDRAYVDALNGQPKFFYDDIDSLRMPNYITRSDVDAFPWAQQYGPDYRTCLNGTDYRELANDQFVDATLRSRTELQQRLMRKRNAEMWQRRIAPISTMNVRM